MTTALVSLGLYAVIVAGLLVANHRWCRTQQAKSAAAPWTDWTLSQPPVPTQADVDATWLAAWPSSVDDVDRLDREFVSIISAEWQWPDTAEDAA